MRCSVLNCTNSTKNASKSEGITFHLFPKDPVIRSAWLEALALTNFEPKERSLVCSDHFRNEDFFDTKMGLRKIKKEAVPVAVLDPDEDLEESATLRVCRVCLTMNTRMYDIKYRNLDQQYEHITGLFFNIEDRLPQKLCWECAHRLHSAVVFRSRAIRAHALLAHILHSAAYISIKDIKSINRIEHKLRSTLVKKKLNENEEYNANIKENVEIKSENYNGFHNIDEKNEKTQENKLDQEEIDNYNQNVDDDFHNQDDLVNDMNEDFNNYKETEVKDLQIMQVEVKDETNSDMFYNEFEENFESDDDKKLSEMYPELVEKRKVKVKDKNKDKKKRVKDKEKKRCVKRKAESDGGEKKNAEDEINLLDKYKTNEIKRRKNEAPNENLFIISSLTYAEQIAEVEKRQESTMYKNAPFKCTICYRGFSAKERYDAHIIRHSDQSGIYECFICKTRLKTSRALRKHLTAQHTEQFSCKGCPFVTRNRGVAREHERWHSGAKYQCPHCPSTFEKVTTYMGHIRIKHVSDFVCELCGYTFVSQKGIDVHKKKKHRLHDRQVELLGPYCDVCDVKFVSEEAHTRHLKLSGRHSSDNDPNRIRNDSQSVRSENTGRTPRQMERRPSIHPRKPEQSRVAGPVPCEQCGVQLRDLRLYAQHFRKAHPDKNRTKYPAMKTPCMCEQCGRIFQSMALLKDHMWVHTGEKRFKCTHCPKSFTQKTNLVFHERVHSSTRPTYECGLCGKHFAFYNNRRRHMFIHTGLKPYKCETCGKSFTTAGEQRAHIEHVHLKKPWPRRARRHNMGAEGGLEGGGPED